MDLNIKKTKLAQAQNIDIPEIFYRRIVSGIDKLDILFGGPGEKTKGVLPGSTNTLTAPGGCGKTTLMLQWGESLCERGYAAAIVSGEESRAQIAFNAKRLGVKKLLIGNSSDVDSITQLMEDLDVIIIDSFQAMRPSAAAVKEHKIHNTRKIEQYCLETIIKAAQKTECAVMFIMHHTKGGQMKGSTNITHSVDGNFCIWQPEPDSPNRWVETDGKNRFGPPGKFSAALTDTGYDFSIDLVESEEDERKRMNGGDGKAGGWSKGARRQAEIDAILSLKEITFNTPIPGFEDMDIMRKRELLSSLHLGGELVKEGRGQKCKFTNPKWVEPTKEVSGQTEEVES